MSATTSPCPVLLVVIRVVLRKRFQRAAPGLGVADARVQQSVEQVDQQIDDHDGHRDDDDNGLDGREVPLEHGLDEQRSNAGDAEDALDDYGAAEEASNCQPDMVRMGSTAFLRPWRISTTCSASPLARAVRM